jgi:sigma-B regulation protein RsbU (phosphoserine phosphatase)
MMAVLREIGGPGLFPLKGDRTLIGRAAECDVVLGVRRVSGHHAQILRLGGMYFVEDLGSSNGTFINGQKIEKRTALKPGDRLEFFGTDLEFRLEDSDSGGAIPQFTLVDSGSSAKTAVMSAINVDDTLRTDVAPAAKLRAVLEFTKNLARALDLKEVLPRILESLFAIFPQADRGFILLRDANTGKLMPKAVRHRRDTTIGAPAISRTILDHALQTGKALLSADAGHDARFDSSQSVRQHQLRSIMCVPIIGQEGGALGIIQLDTQSFKVPFTQDDLDVLVVAGTQAGRALELTRLHHERRDLEAATQIQKSFLPDERPKVAGLHFFDFYQAAQQIGGDYFDYIRLPGNRLAVAIGDVAGKGVPAALLMARLSAEVRYTLATEPVAAIAVRQLNLALKRACGDDRFVTFLVAIIELDTFRFTLVNAGHLPLLRRTAAGEVELLAEGTGGIPLGIFDRPYQETTGELHPGEVLLFATDGVTDARNPDNDLFGFERLRPAFAAGGSTAESAGRAVLAEVQKFSAGRPNPDDVTIVAVSREPQ